jgi:hypothetical protein
VTKAVKQPSFFHFFNPPTQGADDEEPDEAVAMDFEIGDIIKDKVVPAAVLWFTGEASMGDDEDDFGEGEDGEEGEEEDEEDVRSLPLSPFFLLVWPAPFLSYVILPPWSLCCLLSLTAGWGLRAPGQGPCRCWQGGRPRKPGMQAAVERL